MDLSIIILNYSTFDLTCSCVKSIINYTVGINYEIIIVDNASSECNPNKFIELFPHIKLIANSMNVGFAKGNNLGIIHATGDFILLINSDTYLIENAINKALSKFKSLSKIGFLGVKMHFPDGRIQYTARKFRTVKWELLDLFRFILYLLPYNYRSSLMQGRYFKGDRDLECDWLNGAFLMFNRSVLNELPGSKLDERFFMYAEDHLWGYQFTKLGYKNFFYAGTSIVHINNASTSKEKRFSLLKIMYNNELEIIKERYGVGIYFYLLVFIYGFKEKTRMILKKYFFKL